jgi:hypothetical protein
MGLLSELLLSDPEPSLSLWIRVSEPIPLQKIFLAANLIRDKSPPY